MQKWEICRLGTTLVNSPMMGKKTFAHTACLFTPSGTKVIAQTNGYREDDGVESERQLEQLIAQLGLGGWEPCPVEWRWYFKRPIP